MGSIAFILLLFYNFVELSLLDNGEKEIFVFVHSDTHNYKYKRGKVVKRFVM